MMIVNVILILDIILFNCECGKYKTNDFDLMKNKVMEYLMIVKEFIENYDIYNALGVCEAIKNALIEIRSN